MMHLGQLSQAMKLMSWPDTVAQIIDLTIRAWDTEMDQSNSDQEDRITDHLLCAIQRLQKQEEWAEALTIDGQRNEYDAESNTLMGRNDIVFQLGGIHSFTWECKVLHRGGDTLYSKYRREGIARFLNGQYQTSEGLGGMLAYVINGTIQEAIKGLEKHLSSHIADLKCVTPILKSSQRLTDDRLRESFHQISPAINLIHAILTES